MDLQKIIDNGGATLTKDLKDAMLTTGYAVSIPNKFTRVLTIKDDYATIVKAIEDMAKVVIPNASYVGLWVDNDNIYIDETFIYHTLYIAKAVAKEHKQKAIYDIVRKETIPLDK